MRKVLVKSLTYTNGSTLRDVTILPLTSYNNYYEYYVWLYFVFYFCRMAALPKLDIALAERGMDRGTQPVTNNRDEAGSNPRYAWNVAITMHVWTCNSNLCV